MADHSLPARCVRVGDLLVRKGSGGRLQVQQVTKACRLQLAGGNLDIGGENRTVFQLPASDLVFLVTACGEKLTLPHDEMVVVRTEL